MGGVGVLFALGTYYTVDDLPVSVKWDAEMVLNCLNDTAFIGPDGQEEACTPPKEDSVEGKIRLPLLWLNRLLGYLAEPLNFPVRFLAMTALAISALGALAVAPLQWPERVRTRVPTLPSLSLKGRSLATWPMVMVGYSLICLVTVAKGQLLDWPWARFTLRPAKELEVLREEPDLAVVDLGLTLRSDEENRFSALATQIAHGKAMNAVPVERIEFFAREGKHFVNALQLISDLAPLYQGGEGSVPGQCSDGIDNDGNSFADCMDEAGCKRYTACGGQIEDTKDAFPQYKPEGFYRGDMALLRDAGFGWMVVSYRKGDQSMPPALQSTLDQVLGPSVVLGPGLGAWEIPDVEYSDSELEIWSENHAKRVADAQATAPTMGPADGANPAGGTAGPSGPTPPPPPPPMR